jgi:hypothetical protein
MENGKWKMEKSGAHRCALGAKFKLGNGNFHRSPPALHPPFLSAAGEGAAHADISGLFNQIQNHARPE